MLHSSTIIISYTTISTVSFSTTQTQDDAKTQDLIHLRSGMCIFSRIWIHTRLAFKGSSKGREKGTEIIFSHGSAFFPDRQKT